MTSTQLTKYINMTIEALMNTEAYATQDIDTVEAVEGLVAWLDAQEAS
jgi:hypothetical protein